MSLRELRQKRGLTQEQLANKCGLSQRRISSLEIGGEQRDITRIELGTAIRIADALKVRDLRKLLPEDSPSLKENSAD